MCADTDACVFAYLNSIKFWYTMSAAALALLPPLWKITSEYLNLAEQWYYADIEFLRLAPVAIIESFANKSYHELIVDGKDNRIETFLELIIEGNDVHILEALLHAVPGFYFLHRIIEKMICRDRPRLLEFVRDHRSEDLETYYAVPDNKSAEAGVLGVLNWEQRRGYKLWTLGTARRLLHDGNLSVLKRLKHGKRRCPLDDTTLVYAIQRNYVDAVKWLRHVGNFGTIKFSPEILLESVEMIKYFLDDPEVLISAEHLLINAIRWGNLAVVKYLVENTDAVVRLGESEALKMAALPQVNSPAVSDYLRLRRGDPFSRRRKSASQNK